MLFLIDYDRRAGKLAAIKQFDETRRKEAGDARLALEMEQQRSGVDHEIVLLDAEDETALRKTHRRYFETVEAMVEST
jgi:hypothetical protein